MQIFYASAITIVLAFLFIFAIMAYNPFNKYKKAVKVQAIYKQYAQEGVTAIYIYNNYIKDQFNISLRTYYEYLATNASAELKRNNIEIPVIRQTVLFS